MSIQAEKVVTINYTLKNDAGEVIDASSDGSFCYLHGANNIIPGLENALTGKTKNEQFSIVIPPAEAYGDHNPAITQVVDKSMFGDEPVEAGMQFHAQAEDGNLIMITIAEVNGDQVTIDGNHPLAGVTLHYDIHIVDVRDATDEELSHGHVHAHGHSCGH